MQLVSYIRSFNVIVVGELRGFGGPYHDEQRVERGLR